ncbi:MAG: SHOCT domain-containing protein [Gemmatimonadota bacterium]|nr:SHOCT domain-containing protein [Gemmatimonadota bacterium]
MMMLALLQAATVVADHRDGWGHGWWPLWPFLWLALGIAAVWFLRRRWREPRGGGLDRAREILAERYARGELSGDEYRQRLAELSL